MINDVNDNPLVSIIVPNFNRANLIIETLDSVASQTYSNWECVIVDDGSTDDSEKVIKAYCEKDARFKYYRRHRTPNGAPTCRNIGLEKSCGEFIVFLDSDDLLAPSCLKKRVREIQENSGFDFWIFPSAMFLISACDINKRWNVLNKKETDLIRFLLQDAPWSIMGPIWRKEALKQLNGFNELAICWQDWELHVRAIIAGLKYLKTKDELPDSYVRTRNPQIAISISQNHNAKEHVLFRAAFLADFYYQFLKKFNNQTIKLAYAVLIFRLIRELMRHGFRKQIKQMIKFSVDNDLLNLFESILLSSYVFKISVNRIDRLKNRILYRIMVLINPIVFANKENSSFQS